MLRSRFEHIFEGIAGLNNAGRSKEGIRRLIWMVIFLVGFAGTLKSVIVVVQDMNKYPVDTRITLSTEDYVCRTKYSYVYCK